MPWLDQTLSDMSGEPVCQFPGCRKSVEDAVLHLANFKIGQSQHDC
jgi:hypothetical protein